MEDFESKEMVRLNLFNSNPENYDNMDRESLKNLCKAQGIKANLSTAEMKRVLKAASEGQDLDLYYFRTPNRTKVVTGGLGFAGLIALAIILFFLSRQSPIMAPVSPPSNYTL